jgi:hypothetical protein
MDETKKELQQNDFMCSNMAGPRTPWKFAGCELDEIFLHNSSLGGEPLVTMVSVGSNYRLSLTYDKGCLESGKAQ